MADENEIKKEVKPEDIIVVSVSPDKMEAYINLKSQDDIQITYDMIKEILIKNNIVYGIDEEKLKTIIKDKLYNINIKIASGKKSIDGVDGYLTYHFNLNRSAKPELLEDGSVDFHNLNIVENVEADQLLVTYTFPVDGEDGHNVLGTVMPYKKGKSYILPKGKRVKISDDGTQLLAEIDGNVEIIDGKVSVSDVMTINGDVDVGTGDLYFKGDIIITGNVITGFSVTSLGSITVEGYVEASTLRAEGDIILKNGIQGAGKGKLLAGGNIVTKFIEMSEVYSKGVITTNVIMNSIVESESDIIVNGTRGYIIGGLTKALNKIQATGLGNISEIATTLEVGFTEESIKKLSSLEKRIDILSHELEVMTNNMNSSNPKFNKIELMRQKIEKSAEYTSSIKEYKRLKELREKAGTPRIDIEKVINAGTILFMKSDIYKVKNTMKSTSFIFGTTNRIVVIPYNKS